MKTVNYKSFAIKGKATFELESAKIETEQFELEVKALQQSDMTYAVDTLRLTLYLQDKGLTLRQHLPSIGFAEVVTFIGLPTLKKNLNLSEEMTSKDFIKTYKSLLFDLQNYVWQRSEIA